MLQRYSIGLGNVRQTRGGGGWGGGGGGGGEIVMYMQSLNSYSCISLLIFKG